MTCDGDYQRYLATRLAIEHDVCGCIVHATRPDAWSKRLGKFRNPLQLIEHLSSRFAIRNHDHAVQSLHRQLFYVDDRQPTFPAVPRLDVSDVNRETCCHFVREVQPDVIVVNGTNLLREPMFTAAADCKYGIINIHTGLSPYSRGGNCNLHCILHRQPQYVGVTVHYIDAGIDSGDIILTGRPRFELTDTIESLEEKVFRLGIDLLLAGLVEVEHGSANRVKQWMHGRLFLKRTGYDYHPGLRIRANDILRDEGLIKQYFAHRDVYDERVKLVTSRATDRVCRGVA